MLRSLQCVRRGDFSVRLPVGWPGLMGEIADCFNDIVSINQRMAEQIDRVGQVVGHEGRTRERVRLSSPSGAWSDMENSVNTLIDDLLWPTTEVTRTIEAVAQGDLLQTMRLDVDGRPLKGEFLRSAMIVNTMIKQLSVFTSEVTRVAREVGTEGRSAARPTCAALPAPGRTSPTASTPWRPTSPPRSETSPRSQRQSPTATCPRRLAWMCAAKCSS